MQRIKIKFTATKFFEIISTAFVLSIFCLLTPSFCMYPQKPPLSENPEVKKTGAKKTIDHLIKQLGSSNWRIREKAQIEIEKQGETAIPSLKKALNNSDPEIIFRVKELLSKIDPLEVSLILLSIITPPSSPGKWYIKAARAFHGNKGQISFPEFGHYNISLKQDLRKAPQLTLKMSSLGTFTPVELDFSKLQGGTFLIIENRIQIQSLQQGIHMKIEQSPSMLIAWAKTGLRSQLKKEHLPLDIHAPGDQLQKQLMELLYKQLSLQTNNLNARLSAGELLSILGEKKALPLLEDIGDSSKADIARARLGSNEAHARLIRSIKNNQNSPETSEALLTLAGLGNKTALDLLIKQSEELSDYNFKKTALIASNQLLFSPEKIKFEEKRKLVAEALSPLRSSWQTTIRYLLYSIAQEKKAANELLLPSIEKILLTPTSAASFSTCIYIIKEIIAKFPPSQEKIQKISGLLALHSIDSNWQKIVTAIPYLLQAGGNSILHPFIEKVREALKTSKSSYPLKNTLTALAILTPHGTSEHKELVKLLISHLKVPVNTTTRIVSEPLSILLKIPSHSLSSTSVKKLIEATKVGSTKHVLPEYEVFLWNVLRKNGKITIQDHFYFNVKSLDPFSFTDSYGNKRFLIIYPQNSFSNGSIRIITPGASTYVQLELPSLLGVFPDINLKNVYQSNLFLSERYQQTDDFQKMVVYVKSSSTSTAKQDMSWDQMINQSLKRLSFPGHTSFRTRLQFFSKLEVHQAIPTLKNLFQKTKDELIAATLVHLGDDSGRLFLLKNLESKDRAKRLSSVKFLLNVVPGSIKGIETLVRLIRSNKQTIELYTLTSTVRIVLNGQVDEKYRQLLLDALISILKPSNSMSIIPILRSETGLNFGLYEIITMKDKAEKTKKIQKIIQSWKQFFIQNLTDKK